MVFLTLDGAPKVVTGAKGYIGAGQGLLHQLLKLGEPLALHDVGDVREEIECAVGRLDRTTIDGIQSGNGRVSTIPQYLDDCIGTRADAADGVHHASLNEVSGTGFDIGVEFVEDIDDSLGSDGGTETPTSHGKARGTGVEDDGSLLHARQANDGFGLDAVLNLKIGIVT